jgi:hypothetical protein
MTLVITKKVKSPEEKRIILRQTYWPNVSEKDLWLRKKNVGFTTIPRTMSLIGRIMDHLSGKGFPLFGTYLALWCRVYDEGFVEIRNDREMAFESGFSGPRGEVTWRTRMRRLQELGFIAIHKGLASDLQYVLILNPIKVIGMLYEKQQLSHDTAYLALKNRLLEVGANDLEPEPETEDS